MMRRIQIKAADLMKPAQCQHPAWLLTMEGGPSGHMQITRRECAKCGVAFVLVWVPEVTVEINSEKTP